MKIKASDISVRFKRKGKHSSDIKILESIGFEIEPGKVTHVSGRSGSGKTTLINVLAGLLKPTDGKVLYGDTDIYSLSDEKLSEFRSKNIACIPQGQSALSNLTVIQNLLLSQSLFGNSDEQAAKGILERVGLSSFENAYPDELSGGELRRLAAARALLSPGQVIFADEPTNDLDSENAALILELLKGAAADGRAVVIVSHESETTGIADICYKMESGKIIVTKDS